MHDFSKTPTLLSNLKKAFNSFADSQKLKACGNSSNPKTEATLFVLRFIAKNFSRKCFRCNKSGHMKNFCTVKQCSICKKFRHNESKCFRESKLVIESEERTISSKGCEFFSIVLLIVRKVRD